jgi:hypothetical protein
VGLTARGGSSPLVRISALRADKGVEQSNAVSVGDRDVFEARLRPPNAEEIAVLAEDASDIGRVVREEVPDVGIGAHTPTRKHDSKPV